MNTRGLALGATLFLVPRLFAPELAHADQGGMRLPEIPAEYLVHEDDGFLVAYHPGTRERVRGLLPRLAEMRQELRERLGFAVLSDVEIRVGAMPIDLRRLLPAEGSEGQAVFAGRVLVLHAERELSSSDLERTIRRELSRLALREAQGEVPDWFAEGFAAYSALPGYDQYAQVVGRTTLGRTRPELDLSRGPAADAEGVLAADFVRFLERSPGRLSEVTRARREGQSFEASIVRAFDAEPREVARLWRNDVAVRHTLLPLLLALLAVVCAVRALARLRRPAEPVEEPRRPPRQRRRRDPIPARRPSDRDVPRVEHGGRWHTLH